MGCGNCGSGGCAPAGCKSNGNCLTGGCQKLEVYDWLSGMDLPSAFQPFQIVEVKFKGSRKEFFLNSSNIYVEIGELVAVEGNAGGYDVGHVSLTGELVRMQLKRRKTNIDQVQRIIYRKANEADVLKWKAAKDLEYETMHKARKLALELGLQMKISDVDYQGDRTKATFYYTAYGRVDFRELIKRMAESFKVRIEMRQIGMRQEASRLGGIGSCGRELCCSTWLTNFKTVSTAAARYQNLSLNTLKLAGQCGKLKCCLNYELDTYMDALRDIPVNVDYLDTLKGKARLQKTDIFKGIMWFSYPNEDNWMPLEVARVTEIQKLNRKGEKPADLRDIAMVMDKDEAEAENFDYENVVGQDSLTRLDSKNKRKSKNNKKPKPNTTNNNMRKPAAQNTATAAPRNPSDKPASAPRPKAPKPKDNTEQAAQAPVANAAQGNTAAPQKKKKPFRRKPNNPKNNGGNTPNPA